MTKPQETKSTVKIYYKQQENIENTSDNHKNLKSNVSPSNKAISTFDYPQITNEWKNYATEQAEHVNFLIQNYNSITASYCENWIKLYGSYYESIRIFQDLSYRIFLSYFGLARPKDTSNT